MKLLFCTECFDLTALISEERTCLCGKSKGTVTNNFAVVTGSGKVVCIHNQKFLNALISGSSKVEFTG